jgi:hypothetical protein
MIDNRACHRYTNSFIIRIYGADKSKKVDLFGQGLNIGQGGILFFTLSLLKINAKCTVYFQIKNSPELEKKGRILRLEQADPSKYPQVKANERMYAMQFDSLLSHAELEAICGKVIDN